MEQRLIEPGAPLHPAPRARRLPRAVRGIVIAGAVALGAMYAGTLAGPRQGGFLPGSFSTHSVMPVLVSALFFGAMHLVLLGPMGPSAAVPIVLATLLGYLAARYRESTGSLIPAVIVHALFNVGGMLPGWIVDWLCRN